MDPKLQHFIRYKVTHLNSAIFADSFTNLVMSTLDIPWERNFASDEDYQEFLLNYEMDILSDFACGMQHLFGAMAIDNTLWQVDEYAFSKHLHSLKIEFLKDSMKNEGLLMDFSLKMLFYACAYYASGLDKAPIMAFLEVYSLSCDYYRTERW